MRSFPFLQTSVFVDNRYRFSGNQLATFWNSESNADLSKIEMQGIALEMGFSETTFITEADHPECLARVRIFTPGNEIPFAGHPTLGTAFVMRKKGLVNEEMKKIYLELGIGSTQVEFIGDDTIRMFQKRPEFLDILEEKEALSDAISLDDNDINTSLPLQFVSTGFPFLIVPVKALSAVQAASPNSSSISKLLGSKTSTQILVYTTETLHEDSDVHVRMFAPQIGVIEDPATGSAAGPLAAYLENYDVLDDHIHGSRIRIEQGHEIKRPSLLIAEVVGKENIEQVLVSGAVRLIAQSTFYLDST